MVWGYSQGLVQDNDPVESYLTSVTLPATGITDLAIPATLGDCPVTRIGNSEAGADSILATGSPCPHGTVTIPASATTITIGAFGGFHGTTAFAVDSANPVYRSSEGCIVETATDRLVAIPCGRQVVRVPDGVSLLYDPAVFDSLACKTLILPKTLKKLEPDTIFAGMYRLGTLIFLGGVPEGFSDSVLYDSQLHRSTVKRILVPEEHLAEWQSLDLSLSGATVAPVLPEPESLTALALSLVDALRGMEGDVCGEIAISGVEPGLSYALTRGATIEEFAQSAAAAPDFIRAESSQLTFPAIPAPASPSPGAASPTSGFFRLLCTVE